MDFTIFGYKVSIAKIATPATKQLSQKILDIFSASDKEELDIPELCSLLKATDEFAVMKAISILQNQKKLFFASFNKIYREDGGAIYLPKYSKSEHT